MKRIAIILLALTVTLSAVAADSVSLLGRDLRVLNGAVPYGQLEGAKAILVFQPRCQWCALQARTIQKMQAAGHLSDNFIAVGINGRRPDLLKEAARIGLRLPAYQADTGFFKAARLDRGTPVMLLVAPDGTLVTKLRGYQDETVLTQIETVLAGL